MATLSTSTPTNTGGSRSHLLALNAGDHLSAHSGSPMVPMAVNMPSGVNTSPGLLQGGMQSSNSSGPSPSSDETKLVFLTLL